MKDIDNMVHDSVSAMSQEHLSKEEKRDIERNIIKIPII